MEELIKQFESELAAYLEFRYNASAEQDTVKRFNETEKEAFGFIDRWILNSQELTAGDVELSAKHVIDEFLNSKMNT
ncbi:hypothetical protein ASE21_00095 [Flavobacterium sp. Root901]|uniref:hypothetical protein n=1 Tax=Flavobacterium sp. Root901 TaxID=1736605 RepID=UPI000710AEB9|nr:hypothetical protein [Flavobacterium sp. Root901]KRD12359.1 hypothetical protein ASE21_00095 [Flavobacterium sp. Root901]